MIGNLAYESPNVRFLLDGSLVPSVAQALRLVGYDSVDVSAIGRRGATDTEIIEWRRENAAVWIHADDRARKQHRVQLQTSGIRTIWVYRQRGAMTAREQLRILSAVLPRFLHKLEDQPGVRHYKASAPNDQSAPGLRPSTV